ncbi:MAG: tRNA pseudouridine synthase A [Candidatus Shikimatogenerans sp. AspAUS03]|uniref:tRNA pseudouridine synthase n=1 Tax=Candidatus Shikimatogenerans sp. AspAUS03 TaxID=3158563 RepID=A0AAU7QSQ6_9FLAO
MNRYFLIICFLGYYYNGWQKQINTVNTIENILETKISFLLKSKINLVSCSRTDKGVNALSLYVHFDIKKKLNNDFLKKINFLLPKFIYIKNFFLINNKIHARYTVINRSYIYLILLKKNPFLYKKSIYIYKKINYKKLLLLSTIIKNNKKFYKFTNNNKNINCICNIQSIKWYIINNKILIFYIKSNRFLKKMIRCIIGTILKYSVNNIPLKHFFKIYYNNNLNFLNNIVPSYGLYLLNIKY